MSWLGEQFNSITGKISDFTKDVILNDTSSGVYEQDATAYETPNKEAHNLIQLCEQKDSKIKELLLEKKELENSIVVLDEQNQEAINELLSIKNQLSVENKKLKAELLERSSLGEAETDVPNTFSTSHNLEKFEFLNTEDFKFSQNDFNIASVLSPFIDSEDHDLLNKQIIKLQNVRHLLESKSHDTDCKDFLSKINSYVEYLSLICDHSESLLPVVTETAKFLKLATSSEKVNALNEGNKCKGQCNTGNQGDAISSLRLVHVSSQTDFILSDNVMVSSSSQTYCSASCTGCNSQSECLMCSHMKTELETMNFQNTNLKKDIECLKLEIESKLHLLKTSQFSQTDDMCKCIELKDQLAKAHADITSITKNKIKTEEAFNARIKELTIVSQDLEKDLHHKNQLIFAKDQVLSNDQVKISSLKSDIATLTQEIKISELNNHIVENKTSILSINGENNSNEQEQLSISVSDNDKLLLLQKLKELDLEKNKLIFVLNEKSQECSSLKSDVHRLTNIVASEKQALFKLQKDNQSLRQVKESNLDVDLTKEALQNLSRLVRDKDVEIEALAQKNVTLTDMIQNNSSGAEQMPSLMAERDELSKKIEKMKVAREKFMVTYNNKDQECRKQIAEIKKLTDDVELLQKELGILQQHYESLSQQYEEKQKSLLNAQNEIICLKQKIAHLEQQEVDIKAKYGELLNESNLNSENSKDELNCKLEEIENLNVSLKDKHDLIHEKDHLIHDLSQQIKSLKYQMEEVNKEVENLKQTNCNQSSKLSESDIGMKKIWDEKEMTKQKLSDKQSELVLVREMNEHLNMALKEKEFFVQSLEEKISSLSAIIRGNTESPSSPADIDQILADSKEMYNRAQNFHRERDETLLALNQSQQEMQELKSEMQRLRNSEGHLKNELDRLRKHLLQIEDNYTHEALKSETREKDLRSQITEIERTAKVSTSVVLQSSHQAAIQVASLQEQIALIAGQRDAALEQLSSLEDKVQEYAASLSNLQLVLEQMQKGNEQRMRETEGKCQSDLRNAKQQCQQFTKAIQLKEMQLEESSKALEAASRLSEQLDAKEEIILHLKDEIRKTEKLLRSAVDEINSMKNSTEGKVDRVVMKSLVLGYFSTPSGQKSEVVRLLARVLDFNQQEMAKAGIVVGKNSGSVVHKGIFSSLFGRLPLLGSPQEEEHSKGSDSGYSSNVNDQSFASLFVKFLENESQPIIPLPLPAEKMAREQTSKAQSHKYPPRNQLLTSTPEKNSLLIGISSTFPAFSPIHSADYSSPAPAILQGVLE